MHKIRVAIADDHAVIREGLSLIFDTTDDITMVYEADSGHDLLADIAGIEHDVLLLDINMPGKFVIENIEELKNINPDIPIIIFTVNLEKEFAERIFKAGASGFVNKKNPPEELIEAIRTVHSGNIYMSPKCREIIERNKGVNQKTIGTGDLSTRELQVLSMLSAGKAVVDIADELFLSKHTVANHRKNILAKLGLQNSAELIHYGIKNRLAE